MNTAFELAVLMHSGTPLAITPAGLASWRALAEAGIDGRFDSRPAAAAQRRQASARGTAGVIPIRGYLEQRAGLFSWLGLGTSCESVSQALQEALADPSVGRVILDIDSQGGSVAGLIELADEIFAARSKKPIVAVANSLAASAAYWIGSQAAKFYVTPGGEVGSIGVVTAFTDESKALENQGVDVTLISAGKFKTEGNPYSPLDANARAFIQSRVDDYYASFVGAVARGRGVTPAAVRGGMGQGRCVGAADAVRLRMADAVAPLREVVSGKASAGGISPSAAAARRERELFLATVTATPPVDKPHLRRALHDLRMIDLGG